MMQKTNLNKITKTTATTSPKNTAKALPRLITKAVKALMQPKTKVNVTVSAALAASILTFSAQSTENSLTAELTEKPLAQEQTLPLVYETPKKGGFKPDPQAINDSSASADNSEAAQSLKKMLAQLDYFSAKFSQEIKDIDGQLLQQGSGTLAVSKPNLINWTTLSPEESQIVSDGQALWFYDPFIEQVSVFSLAQAVANTPILLITSADDSLWQDYNVEQLADLNSGKTYLVSSKSSEAQVKSLRLRFSNSKNASSTASKIALENIVITDATGQTSEIVLSEIVLDKIPSANTFEFIVPEGVNIDDQR